jgi:hypothetical protein
VRNIVGAMTDTTADQTGIPAIFSADDKVEKLWIQAYQGEVLGEILFARIAEQSDDPDHTRKMDVLSLLERKTKEALVPSLQRAGISTKPDPDTVSTAQALAEATASIAWNDIMGSFEAITTQFLDLYVRIGELDPTEKGASDLLVAHEVALRDFARLELAGDVDGSLSAIAALPHMQ